MIFATLTFLGIAWWWAVVAAAIVLVPLAWLALAPAVRARDRRTIAVALALRTLGIGLLLVCLLDPQWASRRAVRGANLFAVIADNSRGLEVSDANEKETRGAQLRANLAGPSSTWLPALADTFQVRPYVFDRDLRRVRDFGALDFTGERSDLGAALRKLRERFAGQPLAGVLVFTDGIATDITNTEFDTTGLPPIYPVVIGNGAVRDVAIDRASVRETAFDDTPVTLQADIAASGMGSREIQVAVRRIGAPDAKAPGESSPPPPQKIRLRDDGQPVPATFSWKPGGSGVQFYDVGVESPDSAPLEEATALNDHQVVMVDRGRTAYRILYVGGRPNWEFKFLNRALLDDPQLQMVGLLRVAKREPKFEFKGRAGEASNPMFRGFGPGGDEAPRYDQPVLVRVNTRDETELRGGFPKSAEELFAYDAVILDDVEAAFFTIEQLALLRRFASERGGGLLVLGGVDSLEAGGYADSPLASALPVHLDRTPAAPPKGKLAWKLTREGWLEPWVRVRPTEDEERARLAQMSTFLVANGLASVKPGATVLAQLEDESGKIFPGLIAQRFGAGRVACVAVGDMWRWGLHGEDDSTDLARFWRQVARWLVTDVPAQVTLRVEKSTDAGAGMRLRVTARDKAFRPVDLANARLTIRRVETSANADAETSAGDASSSATAPKFSSVTLPAEPLADAPGQFGATFAGRDAGAYLAEVEVTDLGGQVLGRAQTGWVADPALEEFRSLVPNRALLAEIARRTGGEIVPLSALADFAAHLPERSAPIDEAWSFPLWHTSWVFLVVLACFAAEWGWRRWRGLA